MQVLWHLDYNDNHYLDAHIDYRFRLVDGGEGSLKVFKSEKYASGRFYPASGSPSYGIRGWPATDEALAEESGEGEDEAAEAEESGKGADEAEEAEDSGEEPDWVKEALESGEEEDEVEESGEEADGVEEAEESGEGADQAEESNAGNEEVDYFEDPPEGGHVFYEDANLLLAQSEFDVE